METKIIIDTNASKLDKYKIVIEQWKSLLDEDAGIIANAANLTALLKMSFDWHWVGFYFVSNNALILGPFQGPIACTRIAFDRGICGESFRHKKTIIVPDVNAVPHHIACSSETQSEIVIPKIVNQQVQYVLDVDSSTLADFNDEDAYYLEQIIALLN